MQINWLVAVWLKTLAFNWLLANRVLMLWLLTLSKFFLCWRFISTGKYLFKTYLKGSPTMLPYTRKTQKNELNDKYGSDGNKCLQFVNSYHSLFSSFSFDHNTPQLTFTSLKSTIETLKKVWNIFKVNNKNIADVVYVILVFLLLTLNVVLVFLSLTLNVFDTFF